MNKELTEDFNFIQQFDAEAAEMYKDKKFFRFNVKEIADYREISEQEVKAKLKLAKSFLKNREQAWLSGLSNRAKIAVLANKKYKDFTSLYADIMGNNVDLECLPKIGHKVAVEIRGWVLNH